MFYYEINVLAFPSLLNLTVLISLLLTKTVLAVVLVKLHEKEEFYIYADEE